MASLVFVAAVGNNDKVPSSDIGDRHSASQELGSNFTASRPISAALSMNARLRTGSDDGRSRL